MVSNRLIGVKCIMAWRAKTNKTNGEMTNAVKRRLSSLNSSQMTLSEEKEFRLDLKNPKDRSEFGYCYLEWKDNV
tara:strand:- start:927 stop:1151 length:225 start_codon:yes stop_codon:yes gene_type:complete